MTFGLYTNSISAHQLPLAREIVKRVGAANFRYVYTGDRLQGGAQEIQASDPWIVRFDPGGTKTGDAASWLENCDVLIAGNRDIGLFEHRARQGRITLYQSERWFKPLRTGFDRMCGCGLPGRMRMLVPRYRRMAKRFVAWLGTDANARYLAIGPWARRDMAWLGVPQEKILDWGYFVEEVARPAAFGVMDDLRVNGGCDGARPSRWEATVTSRPCRILWVGRMLDWKRVDTIVRAVAFADRANRPEGGEGEGRNRLFLTLVGDGPERPSLEKLADTLRLSPPTLTFRPPVSLLEVRKLMRAHDVYVLSSNAQEGWGAVVNEALSEGMAVLGTHEAGASAALLPPSNLFHAGDWRALSRLLAGRAYVRSGMPQADTPSGAVDRIMNLLGKL